MNNKKRVSIIVFVLVLIIVSANFSTIYADIEVDENSYTSHKKVLSIDIDDSDSQLNYSLEERINTDNIIMKSGIESFTIDEQGRIYLANFASGSIKIYYGNEYIDEIDISNFTQLRDLQILNDFLYLFEDKGIVTKIDINTLEIIEKYSIPYMIDVLNGKDKNIDSNGYSLMKSMPVRLISNHNHGHSSLLYDNNFQLSFKGVKVNQVNMDRYYLPKLDGQVYRQLIGIDEKSNVYISGIELSHNNDRIEINELIYRFNKNGELLAIAETISDKNYIVPFKYIDINYSGDLFQLLVLEDKVKIFQLYFRDISEFDLDFEENKSQELLSVVSSTINAENVDRRKLLYQRANELINFQWIYNPEIHGSSSKNVLLPFYLKNIEEVTEKVGIPYTWGGYDSLNTRSINQAWENFQDALNKGAIIGNAGATPNYLPGTAGIDCSGLVSAVLGMNSRNPSWYFLYNNNTVKRINYDRLEFMDILVKNGHVLFYLNHSEYGIRSIETNALGSEWKAKYYKWSWRALRDNDYRARAYRDLYELEID
ncbi:hypothetical protein [Natronospora cellulosivora (SeqCode)]